MARPEKVMTINTTRNPAQAFDKIMDGVNKVADAVKLTLGPFGRNFLIEKGNGKITNDGITIAREIQSSDELEDLAIRVFREASIKTNDEAGDGTTTSTTLAQAILASCGRLLARENQFAKQSVLSIRTQIEKEMLQVSEKIHAMAVPVTSEEEMVNVARVSMEDETIATMIGKAQWELGPNGTIIVEETAEPDCSIERIQGVRIDNGLGTSMVMNDPEKQRLVVEDVCTILTNYVINTIAPIQPLLQQLVTSGKTRIVIVARGYSSDAIREIMMNQERGVFIYPMQAPYVNQREVMRDMQAILGGRYIHDEDSRLEDATIQDVGFAKKVIGYRYSAIFTGALAATDRIEQLRKELEGEPSKFQQKAIEQRISQLSDGFALLKIGSNSEVERKYLYDKAEDAVNAVKSALQEGTVRGAGLALKEIADEMPDTAILKKALYAPYQQIMINGGLTPEQFTVEPWVRNSAKVERVACENACRIAAQLVTAGGIIAVEKVKPIDQLLAQKTQDHA